MTDMNTIKITLQTLSELLDSFGADVFPEPELEISVEVPRWLCATFGTALDAATLIQTFDGRRVAGMAICLARAAVAALNSDPSLDDLTRLVRLYDSRFDLTCDHWDADDTGDGRECITLTHISSEVTFTLYVDGIGDRIYGKEA